MGTAEVEYEGEADGSVRRARALLGEIRSGDHKKADFPKLAVQLADALLSLANENCRASERRRNALMARMMEDPDGQQFTTELTDRLHRSKNPQKVVNMATDLLSKLGPPRYLPTSSQWLLKAFQSLAPSFVELASEALKRHIQREVSPYIIPWDPDAFSNHLRARQAAHARVNVNYIGEAVLGEGEAERQLESYLNLLAHPEVETISVKLSAIYSQMDLVSWEATVRTLSERLTLIYRAAMKHRTSVGQPKLVYLDMEAYRDLHLTVEIFMRVLSEPEFKSLTAGMVLQGYIPDSVGVQRTLTSWAVRRTSRGNAPIRLRLVKGANLGVERVESSLRGLALPTFANKAETDACFKRLLFFGLHPERARAANLGVASHNIFDIALALVLRTHHQLDPYADIELLEGMAEPLRRAIQAITDGVLLYGPTVKNEEFNSAIAYLVRRLDENTSGDNFLAQSFLMQPGDAAFKSEAAKFTRAWEDEAHLNVRPRRHQDRNATGECRSLDEPFVGEADTDFGRDANRAWLQHQLDQWRDQDREIHSHLAGREHPGHDRLPGIDPSRPGRTPYYFSTVAEAEVQLCLETAESARSTVAGLTARQRGELLLKVAQELRSQRGELILALIADAGKRVLEADVEISEAIDFAEYYARSILELQADVGPTTPLGTVLVTPPWNFPLAILLGGVFAAFAAGNTVIVKPAPETPFIAECAIRLCHKAGIPAQAVQLLLIHETLGARLIRDERVSSVILTGATSTAQLFRSMRPGLRLCAETGGKNGMLVTAHADHDQAIRDALQSAFGHSGQKCSAASLLVVEREVYEDSKFLERLTDAAASLKVGSAWQLESRVTPLITPPRGPLLGALTELDPGERWLLKPERQGDNPHLWSPGIKVGVAAGSSSHHTEFFGPVLSIMCAEHLEQGLEFLGATEYGLTAGLQSLDPGEQARFVQSVEAGNLYINRGITGAIVGRQPFGGRKASSFGPGAKAGGPNYVAQFVCPDALEVSTEATQSESPARAPSLNSWVERLARDLSFADAQTLRRRTQQTLTLHQERFSKPKRLMDTDGEDNWFWYKPARSLIYIGAQAEPLDVALSLTIAQVAGCKPTLVVAPSCMNTSESSPELDHATTFQTCARLAPEWSAALNLKLEVHALKELRTYVDAHRLERVRVLGTAPRGLNEAFQTATAHVNARRVSPAVRLELLHYLVEQSLSVQTHRYGHLPPREALPPGYH